MWLVTTLEQTAPEILWEMMNRRWDIEENVKQLQRIPGKTVRMAGIKK